jgi:hypothetical protein
MNDPAATRHYRLTRPNGLGFVHRRSATQFAICCAGIGLGLLGLVVTGAGIGGRMALAVAGLLLVGAGAGRTPGGEDLVSLLGPFARFSARRATGRHRWSAALAPWRGAGLPPLFAGITLYDFDAEHALGRSSGRVGLIADRGDASLSVVLRIHGEGFLLTDAVEKDARLAAFGDALASLAREESPVSRITWSQLVAPAPLAGHFAYLAQTSRAEPDEMVASSYGDLLEGTARRAVSSEVLVTLTVAIGRARLGRGEMSDRFSSAIDRLLDEAGLFSTALARAGLFAVGPLPAGAIARALRDRLDPSARRHLERRGRRLADLAGLVTPENGFPLSVEEHRRFVATDGSVHRIFRVAEWPRLSVRADWLAGFLCEQDVTRSFTVIYTPLGRRLARRQALAVATRVGASIDERELKGRRVGAEERRAQLAAEALDEELESGAEMELVAGLVDVTAESPDELDGQCERTCQSAANVGMELRSLDLRHAEALVAALPLGRVIPGRAR